MRMMLRMMKVLMTKQLMMMPKTRTTSLPTMPNTMMRKVTIKPKLRYLSKRGKVEENPDEEED